MKKIHTLIRTYLRKKAKSRSIKEMILIPWKDDIDQIKVDDYMYKKFSSYIGCVVTAPIICDLFFARPLSEKEKQKVKFYFKPNSINFIHGANYLCGARALKISGKP